MDGLSQIVQGMAGPTQSAPLWQQLLTGGLFGAGELGNLLQTQKQNSYQNFLLNLAKNPAQLSAMINKATQPLSNSLVQSVNNTVQGNLAQRGLSQAPGIFATTEAQALAPYVQNEQSLAQQQVMQALGLPGAATNINAPAANLTPALSQFLRTFGSRQTLPPAWNTNQSAPPLSGITLAPTGAAGVYGVPPGGSTPSYFPDMTDWGIS